MPKEYRSRNRILLDLLRAVKQGNGVGTTRLLFLANLSHDRLQEYVGEALRREWITETVADERKTYHLTPTGQRFLTELDRIDRFMADFGMRL